MAHGDFVWCDLSTHDLEGALSFYGDVFNWTFERTTGPDGSSYHIASKGSVPQAAIFEMPEKFKAMDLPSFWMSYIQVESVLKATKAAAILGGTSEIGPTDFGEGSKIALIRDPLGAGFTVYEGSELTPRPDRSTHGTLAWNALHVSDAEAVIPFYETLFGWQIERDGRRQGHYVARNATGSIVSEIREIDEEVRGRFQYWAVYIAVDDVRSSCLKAIDRDGTPSDEDTMHLGKSRLLYDPDGASLFLCPSTDRPQPIKRERPQRPRPQVKIDLSDLKWKTGIALGVLWAAVGFDQLWLWGLLFLMWSLPALRNGETYLIEPILRKENPLLFWAIVTTWIGLGGYVLVAGLLSL